MLLVVAPLRLTLWVLVVATAVIVAVIALISANSVNWTYLVAFLLVAVVTGELLSATALLIEEIGFRRYHSIDLARLTAWGLVEALWFCPVLAWWRVKGDGARAHGPPSRPGGDPRGEAMLEHPAEVVPPLTR
jgi:hypothetical protein